MGTEERYRLVVLGSARVGKTSLIRRYLYQEFSEKYKETVEDLHSREFRVHESVLSLDILDTNFNFPDMRRLAIASANAFLLVFAVDDVQSFKEMSDLWSEICERRADIGTMPNVVAGTKCDLPSKKIFPETAQAWVSRLNAQVKYVEVSAKTNTHVTDIFRTLLELSGFPRCKEDFGIGGLEVEDTDDRPYTPSPPLRRHRSMRGRTPTREQAEHESPRPSPFPPPNVSQMSQPSLAVPASGSPALSLRRNRSLKLKKSTDSDPGSTKTEVQRTLSGGEKDKLSRSGSLIRRTKHMSLKMRRHGEIKNKDEHLADESDCKIS